MTIMKLLMDIRKNYVIKLDNHNEEFKPGVSFEQIFSLFKFDKTLRQMIMIALVDLEEHMRSLISYVIAKNYSSKHIRYLDSKIILILSQKILIGVKTKY